MDLSEETQKRVDNLVGSRNVVVLMRFGSHLYGLDTPQSDLDLKGIFVPTPTEILLQKVPKSISLNPEKKGEGIKNTEDDVDIELYSLQYFLELCLSGQTVGIDMLHANKKNILCNSTLWEFIQSNRSSFYSKDLSALVSYCRKQAAKYGQKGSRISDARKVLHYLLQMDDLQETWGDGSKNLLRDYWENLPSGEHISFVAAGKPGKEEVFYQVCGKKLQKTSKVSYCVEILKNFIETYGKRALLAEKNQGVDWKAVSHAIRYANQLEELFKTGDIKFPLKNREFILKVKKGELDFKGVVSPALDEAIMRAGKASENSCFPDTTDRLYWDKFVEDYYKYIVEGY